MLSFSSQTPVPIRTIASIHIPPANELKVLVGSNDCGVKVRNSRHSLTFVNQTRCIIIIIMYFTTTLQVWNFNSQDPTLETTIPTGGSVEHININENVITWACFEPTAADQPIPVGMLSLLNMADMTTIQAKVVYVVYVRIIYDI